MNRTINPRTITSIVSRHSGGFAASEVMDSQSTAARAVNATKVAPCDPDPAGLATHSSPGVGIGISDRQGRDVLMRVAAASQSDQWPTRGRGAAGVNRVESEVVPNMVSKAVASPARPTPVALRIASLRVQPRRNASSRCDGSRAVN